MKSIDNNVSMRQFEQFQIDIVFYYCVEAFETLNIKIVFMLFAQ